MSVEDDRTSLEVQEAYAEDSGDYRVIARNSVGEAQTSCYVYVTTSSRQPDHTAALPDGDAVGFSDSCPPGFTYIFHDLTAYVAESCTLRVTVTGNPLPKVW